MTGNFKTVSRWRVAKGWLALNGLLASIVFPCVFGWPSKMSLTAEVNEPSRIDTNTGRSFAFTKRGMQCSEITLPMMSGSFALKLNASGKRDDVRLLAVRLRTNMFATKEWPDSSLMWDKSGGVTLVEGDARTVLNMQLLMLLLAFEVLLCGLCWLVLLRKKDVRKDVSSLEAGGAGFVLACFVLVVVPLQSYLGNLELDCNGWLLANELIVGLLLGGVVFATITLFGCRSFGRVFLSVVTAVVVYLYLETGVLTCDCPSLNGETVFYTDRLRRILDIAVLPTLFLVFSLPFIKRKLGWILVGVLVMSIASVFDARKKVSQIEVSNLVVSNFVPKSKVVESCVQSAKKNVVIYLLDCIATPCAVEVMERDPDIRAAFEGFTCFTNNVGMYGNTVPSVAGFSTGEYNEDPTKSDEYNWGLFSNRSFIVPYIKREAKVFLSPGSFEYGYASVVSNRKETATAPDGETLQVLRRMVGQQAWNLYEIVRFRLAPFFLKRRTYENTAAGWSGGDWPMRETLIYPRIAASPIDNECALTLQYWHTEGAHPPLTVDRHGVNCGDVSTGYEAKLEKTWYALSLIAQQLNRLKARKLYDNSFLLVMSDHGAGPSDRSERDDCVDIVWNRDRKGDFVTGVARPLLWVKPIRGHGDVQFSATPTSHCKIHDMLVTEAKKNQRISDVSAVLTISNRLFRAEGGIAFYDCVVDANGKPSYHKTDVTSSLAAQSAVKLDHWYSLLGENRGDIPPVMYDGIILWDVTGPRRINPWHGGRQEFFFKAPKTNCMYELRLRLVYREFKRDDDSEPGVFVIEDSESGRQLVKNESGIRLNEIQTVKLPVSANAKGVVHLKFKGNCSVEMHAMQIGDLSE